MNKVKVYELANNDTCSINCSESGVNLKGPLTVIVSEKEEPKNEMAPSSKS